jgi:hypothetical protein
LVCSETKEAAIQPPSLSQCTSPTVRAHLSHLKAPKSNLG